MDRSWVILVINLIFTESSSSWWNSLFGTGAAGEFLKVRLHGMREKTCCALIFHINSNIRLIISTFLLLLFIFYFSNQVFIKCENIFILRTFLEYLHIILRTLGQFL
jgi:hypothetical protein